MQLTKKDLIKSLNFAISKLATSVQGAKNELNRCAYLAMQMNLDDAAREIDNAQYDLCLHDDLGGAEAAMKRALGTLS